MYVYGLYGAVIGTGYRVHRITRGTELTHRSVANSNSVTR
jgi:hypothetical protein